MGITIKEIADLAGVSRGTVDRALNDRGRIDPEVKERILNLADAHGYLESRKRRNNWKRIGVVTQLNDAGFTSNLKAGIESARNRLKYRNVDVIVRGTQGVNGAEQCEIIDKMVEDGVEGIAIMAADSADVRSKIKELNASGIPVITFNTDLKGSEREFYIGLDNRKSGQTAAGLMNILLQGSGNVLVITGYFTNDVDNQRVEGFMEEVKRSFPGIGMLGVQPCFDQSEEAAAIIRSTMNNGIKPDGILMVSGGQEGVREVFEGIAPEDRPKVIVYDRTKNNEEMLNDGIVDFVLGQQIYQQGYRAPMLLSDLLLAGEKPDSEYIFTDTIIITKYNM